MKSWDLFLVNFGITNIKVIHLWKVFIQSDLQTVAYSDYSLCEHLLYSVFCILYSVFCIHLLYCSGAEAEPGAGSCPTAEGARGGGGDHEARPGAQSEGEVDQMWE